MEYLIVAVIIFSIVIIYLLGAGDMKNLFTPSVDKITELSDEQVNDIRMKQIKDNVIKQIKDEEESKYYDTYPHASKKYRNIGLLKEDDEELDDNEQATIDNSMDFAKTNESVLVENKKMMDYLFTDPIKIGNDRATELMIHKGNKFKMSKDIQAGVNKYTNYDHIVDDLEAHANSIWWENDGLQLYT